MEEVLPSRVKDDSLVVRNRLALRRTMLANERTLLAYVRTSLGLLLVALAILHFERQSWLDLVGVLFAALSALTLVAGLVSYMRTKARILERYRGHEPGTSGAPGRKG
jgi:putative membrane protein